MSANRLGSGCWHPSDPGAARAARGSPGSKAGGWAAPSRDNVPRGMGGRWRVPLRHLKAKGWGVSGG